MLRRVEKTIEVRYAGVVIGRVATVGDVDAQSVFLGISDPMPVGSTVSLKVDEQLVEGRVQQVTESTEPSRCGMRVRLADANAASLFTPDSHTAEVGAASAARPAPPAAAAAPKPAAPIAAVELGVPVQEIVAEPSVAESDGTAPSDSGAGDDQGGPAQGAGGGGGGGRRRRRRR
jgi:hypothetical protein